MKVADYYVRWRYRDIDVSKGTLVGLTESEIKQLKGSTKELVTCTILDKDKKVISNGYACRNFLDAPNNETGRKISLTKAFFTSDIDDDGKPVKNYIFSKDIRAKFWEAYRTMTKQPKWESKKTKF